ncbi:MAG: oligosaccharide flippase family protein [Actinomycetota bacterium]
MEEQKGRGGSGDEALSKQAAADVNVVAKGGAVQVVGQVTQRSLSFFFSAVAIRILGAGGFGRYSLVLRILSNAAQFGLAGFNYAAMRFITKARAAKDHGAVRGAIRDGLIGAATASILVTVALLALAGPLASVFGDSTANDDALAELLRISFPYVILFALLQVLRYCTQAYKTMVPSVMAGNVIQPAFRFVIGVAVLAAGGGVAGAIISLNVSLAIAVVAAAWYLRRMLTQAEMAASPRPQFRPMLRFAIPQAGASLLGVQTLGVGILLLGVYESDAAVGLFAVALQLQGPGNVFLGGIVNIWAPVVSDLHEKGEIARLEALYQMINRWIATFSFPVFAALIIEPDVFVDLFAGREGTGAASVVAILAVGNFFYTGTGPTGYVISMTGRPGVNFINSLVSVLLYIGLGIAIVPDHGVVGMAVVDAIVTALVNSARVIEAKILVGVQPFGRTFYKPVVATIVGAAALLLWRWVPGDSIPVEITGIVVAAAIYIWTLARLGIDPEERHVIERIKKRAVRRK